MSQTPIKTIFNVATSTEENQSVQYHFITLTNPMMSFPITQTFFSFYASIFVDLLTVYLLLALLFCLCESHLW